jgi:hypothetical protein
MKKLEAPVKPIAPSLRDKSHTYNLNIIDLVSHLQKTKYEKYDEELGCDVEISKEEYNLLYDQHISGISEIELNEEIISLEPSIEEILKLVPPGIPLKDVHLKLDVEQSDYYSILGGLVLYYTTPRDYEAEKNQYDKDLIKYKLDLENYKNVLLPEYKAKLHQEKILKQEKAIASKKKRLENELKRLNNDV